jgi:phage anti-repressor protein
MLIAYVKLSQEGIEPLPVVHEMIKDKQTGHYYFDHFRVILQCYINPKERVSGMAILGFAPNGTIWLETSEYCYELGELASYYFVMDLILEEAKKSHVKVLEIMLPSQKVIDFMQSINPSKLIKAMRIKDKKLINAYKQIHRETKEKFASFGKVILTLRRSYPQHVLDRLIKHAEMAAEPPRIGINGQWLNQIGGKSYYNIGMTEAEEKQFAEDYARICYEFTESYLKEYEHDYGKEATSKLIKDLNEKKIKDFPPTKRVLAESKESIPINIKKLPFKKDILCQNCDGAMKFEKASLEKPENRKIYTMRCKKCLATKALDEKGRIKYYGRYSKKK